jgi:hypothetical protein
MYGYDKHKLRSMRQSAHQPHNRRPAAEVSYIADERLTSVLLWLQGSPNSFQQVVDIERF